VLRHRSAWLVVGKLRVQRTLGVVHFLDALPVPRPVLAGTFALIGEAARRLLFIEVIRVAGERRSEEAKCVE
jgi:hypothetical protein